jgi:hypothetical protein
MTINCFIPLVDKMPPDYKKQAQQFIAEGLKLGYWEKKEFVGVDNTRAGKTTKKKNKELTEAHRALFEQFWDEYGLKKGKKGAMEVWAGIPHLEEQFSKIMYAAKKEYNERGALIAKGSTPKWAQGWLTEERWLDCEEPPSNIIKYKKDTEPEGWREYWFSVTGKECEHDWKQLSPITRTEIMEGIQ